MKKIYVLISAMMVLFLFACGQKKESKKDTQEAKEPDHIIVQHVLIAFQGSIQKPGITRSKEEAKKLAMEIFERAKQGEDFHKLVKNYTDDAYPGTYRMANYGVSARKNKREYPRTSMVPAFGDIAFKLSVGEIGIAHYNQETSPYGWHIIKRIK